MSPFEHEFPPLTLPVPPAWVAWNLGAAADRLDEPAFQVQLVRPLRGEKHVPRDMAALLATLKAGHIHRLTPFERILVADELQDWGGDPERALLAAEVWEFASVDAALREHLLRQAQGQATPGHDDPED